MSGIIKLVNGILSMTGITLPKPHEERRVALTVVALGLAMLVGIGVVAVVLVNLVLR